MSVTDRIWAIHKADPRFGWRGARAELVGLYRSLSPEAVHELAQRALNLVDSDHKVAADVLSSLVSTWPQILSKYQRAMLDHERLVLNSHLFHGADESLAVEIITRLRTIPPETNLDRDWLLMALAWTHSDRATEQFRVWRDDPPHWDLCIHNFVSKYTLDAGWTISAEGLRRELFPQHAYHIVKRDIAQPAGPVRVGVTVDDTCPYCQRRLVDLLSFDMTQLPHLGLQGNRLRIRTCPSCLAFRKQYIYCAVDQQGQARVDATHSDIVHNSDTEFKTDGAHLTLGTQRSSPYEELGFGNNGSQIGGFPTWMQGPDYPMCPQCGELMPYLAQVEDYEIGLDLDGVFYAFLCEGCGRAATLYQNT